MLATKFFSATLGVKWARYRELHLAAHDNQFDCLINLEQEILQAPVSTLEDAIIKLEMVALLLKDGERCDASDSIALEQVIYWLKAPTPRLPAAS